MADHPPITDRSGHRHRGVSLDVDGTLYKVSLGFGWQAWRSGWLRTLERIRDGRNTLRERVFADGDAARDALVAAIVELGETPEEARAMLVRARDEAWPGLLPGRAAASLAPALQSLREAGVRLAAFSDDHAGVKVEALGLGGLFDVVVSAEDAGAYKPGAPGYRAVLEGLDLPAEAVLHAGDRVDTDVAGALALGWDAALVGSRKVELPVVGVADVAELAARVLAAPAP